MAELSYKGIVVPGDVITTEELRGLVGTDRVCLFDVRDPEAYREGHIPGAVNLPPSELDRTEILDSGNEVMNQLRPVSEITAYLRAAGISNDRPVCIYDEGGGYLAARLWWALDVAGHANPRLLDGGFFSWTTEVNVVTTEVPMVTRGNFVPAPIEGKRLDFSDVITGIGNPRVVLCGSMPRELFLRQTMPGSICFPYTETYTEDNYPLLKSRHELAATFAEHGITHRHHVICFCSTGYSATQLYFAARYSGFPQVSVYDGSMLDWYNRGGELVRGTP